MATAPVRKLSRSAHRRQIHRRMRKKLAGTTERPRLSVFRSLRHMYAQVIDDQAGRTVAAASSVDKEFRQQHRGGSNIAAAKLLGKIIGERACAAGITRVVFDRGGYRYHGRVQALAEAAREAGLKF